MKYILLPLSILCVFASCFSQGIEFEHGTFASVKAKAKKERKLIFVDFYTSWCGPCKKMAETVFKQDSVGDFFNSRFISYKIDAEKGEGKSISKNYKVEFYPTYVFIDHEGNLYDRAIGYTRDSAFLAFATKAQNEYTQPDNLTRLRIEYPKHKNDTAFLKKYINKLAAAQLHSTAIIEQYLSVQTAMPENSAAMLSFLAQNGRELTYGGHADRILTKNMQHFKAIADSATRAFLNFTPLLRISRTVGYAKELKSEALVRLSLAKSKELSNQPFALITEGTWLDYYASTGNWQTYHKLANKWLDSICLQLKPWPADEKSPLRLSQEPEAVYTRRVAYMVSQQAKVYLNHFTDEKDVAKKTVRWVEKALKVMPDNAYILTFYANLLYKTQDTTRAIEMKKLAIVKIGNSLHKNLMQSNLEHMQKGEMLEEE